jgi:hypothetical protein
MYMSAHAVYALAYRDCQRTVRLTMGDGGRMITTDDQLWQHLCLNDVRTHQPP